MSRASYTVTKVVPKAVYIVDNNDGKTSVTNDAEAVVAEILAEHPAKRIFYRDSQAQWAELVHNNSIFLRFSGISTVTFKQFFQ